MNTIQAGFRVMPHGAVEVNKICVSFKGPVPPYDEEDHEVIDMLRDLKFNADELLRALLASPNREAVRELIKDEGLL